MKRISTLRMFALLALVCLAGPTLAQPCTPHWEAPFVSGGLTGRGRVLQAFNDGSGPGLFVGGDLTDAGGLPAGAIARWNGQGWNTLAGGLSNPPNFPVRVSTATTFDDGTGPALYVGGVFSMAGGSPAPQVARWNGQTWTALGTANEGAVYSLAVFDDGTGPALYAGGRWPVSSPTFGGQIVRWTGADWVAVGGGVSSLANSAFVQSLFVYDFGNGPELVVSGSFSDAGAIPAANLAKWNGTAWSAVGNGFDRHVNDWAVFNGALYATGEFGMSGGAVCKGIARWEGGTWVAVGSGMTSFSNYGNALEVFDDGSGEKLYLAGFLQSINGVSTSNVARFDGTTWQAVGSLGNDFPRDLAVFDDGTGPELYAIGGFSTSGPVAVHGIARWHQGSWKPLGSGPNDTVNALAAAPEGVYVGGDFTTTADQQAGRIARWSASGWSNLGGGNTGLSTRVSALVLHPTPAGGNDLMVAGTFGNFGGVTTACLARFDGSTWSSIGSIDYIALSLASAQEGPVRALYVGGLFDRASGVLARRIARWDGAAWSAMGSGVSGGSQSRVDALAVFDDGTGQAVYAGGEFTTAGGTPALNIAKWNGTAWSAMGTGLAGTGAKCNVLQVYDDGSGPALYVGGPFTHAGGVVSGSLAKWRNGAWSAVPGPFAGYFITSAIHSMAVFDDGRGPALYVGGNFDSVAGITTPRIARWDGSQWEGLGSGLGRPSASVAGSVYALCVAPYQGRPALWVGGDFLRAGGMSAERLAVWVGCNPPCYPNCDGSSATPILNVNDFTCFLNRFAAGEAYANCDGSTAAPILNINDFVCFQQQFAAGCP